MNAASWLESLPPRDRWRDLALAHGPRIATWTLALALGVQAALIVTDLAGGIGGPAATSAPMTPVAVPPGGKPRTTNVAAIVNAHLFGRAGGDAIAVDPTNAPQTSMPLVLTGIIAGDDPKVGLAIIGENANSARVKAVGDSLSGGAVLHGVYADRVLIERGGRIESLALPRQYNTGPPPPMPSVSALPATENPVIERMRRLVNEDPGLVADIMRPQAVFAQGKQRGYRVYPGRNRQAFLRLGLRPGDLVIAINGTPLDDPARGQEIFQTIGSASEAQVTVLRNGRQQDLTLNMAQVAQEAEQMVGAGDGSADQVPPDQAPAVAPPADSEAGIESGE